MFADLIGELILSYNYYADVARSGMMPHWKYKNWYFF
jgi:hypothetical protein